MVISALLSQFISLSPASTMSRSLFSVWGSIQFSSVTQSCLTLCNHMDCSIPGPLVHHQLPEFAQTSNHLILCCPLLLLPSIFPSIRVFFQWVSSLHQMVKVLEFQLQHQSFQWVFRVDFLYDWLLGSPCIQGTLKSLLQHHSSKASVLWYSALFMVLLSHPYMTIGKTIALTRWTFVGNVVSLLFNTLSMS